MNDSIIKRALVRLRILAQRLTEIDTLRQQIGNLEASIPRQIAEATMRLRLEMLQQRRALIGNRFHPTEALVDHPHARHGMSLDECFAQLAKLAPSACPIWRELLEVNRRAYDGFPVDSCSVHHHPMADAFQCFIRPYLTGRVLDIGCGPQPVPWYLDDYPVNYIWGLDPISRREDHPFSFVSGVAEFLPWDDGQFETVIVATSLDHVLLVDRAFAEMHRVLAKPAGRLLVWASFVEQAAPYNPYGPGCGKIDDFHLFHFDAESFREAIAPCFEVCEEFALDRPQNSHFFCLGPK
ncbi:MAG: methyltransferase domain-containing protein [Planctomycetia bacterium]|nr:methyltransferase domain-containing protein [Planctomycetia bacterium]